MTAVKVILKQTPTLMHLITNSSPVKDPFKAMNAKKKRAEFKIVKGDKK